MKKTPFSLRSHFESKNFPALKEEILLALSQPPDRLWNANTLASFRLFCALAPPSEWQLLLEIRQEALFKGRGLKLRQTIFASMRRMQKSGVYFPLHGFTADWLGGRTGTLEVPINHVIYSMSPFDFANDPHRWVVAAGTLEMIDAFDATAAVTLLSSLPSETLEGLAMTASPNLLTRTIASFLFPYFKPDPENSSPLCDWEKVKEWHQAYSSETFAKKAENCAERFAALTNQLDQEKFILEILNEMELFGAVTRQCPDFKQQALELHAIPAKITRSLIGEESHRKKIIAALRRVRNAALTGQIGPVDSDTAMRALAATEHFPEDAVWLAIQLCRGVYPAHIERRISQAIVAQNRQVACELAMKFMSEPERIDLIREIAFRLASCEEEIGSNFWRQLVTKSEDPFCRFTALHALERDFPGLAPLEFVNALATRQSEPVKARALAVIATRTGDPNATADLRRMTVQATTPAIAAVALACLAWTPDPEQHIDLFASTVDWFANLREGASSDLPGSYDAAPNWGKTKLETIEEIYRYEQALFCAAVHGLMRSGVVAITSLLKAFRHAEIDGHSYQLIMHVLGDHKQECSSKIKFLYDIPILIEHKTVRRQTEVSSLHALFRWGFEPN